MPGTISSTRMNSQSQTAKLMRLPKRPRGKLAGAFGQTFIRCRLGSIATGDARRVRSVPSWDNEWRAPKNRGWPPGNPHGYEVLAKCTKLGHCSSSRHQWGVEPGRGRKSRSRPSGKPCGRRRGCSGSAQGTLDGCSACAAGSIASGSVVSLLSQEGQCPT